MLPLTDYLKGEHKQSDVWFVLTESAVSESRWAEAIASFNKFEAANTRHIGFEEDILFPELDHNADMVAGPTDIMRREHIHLRHLLSAMHDALMDNDRKAFYENADLFRIVNHQHSQMEEHILYPMADKALGPRGMHLLATVYHIDEGCGCSCQSHARIS